MTLRGRTGAAEEVGLEDCHQAAWAGRLGVDLSRGVIVWLVLAGASRVGC